MADFKKIPAWIPAVLLFGLLFGGGIRELLAGRKTAVRALGRLELKLHELAQCEAAVPALTEDNAVAIEQELVRARQLLTAMQDELRGRGGAGADWHAHPAPSTRTDAFFDLASFVEQARERVVRSGITLKPDERFGFSSYTAEGPAADLIPFIFRQRLMVEHFVDLLLIAHPHRLVSIQREPPAGAASGPQGVGGSRAQAASVDRLPPDYFVIDPRLSVRSPGMVEATAFRIVFIGSTASLRTFINQLANFERPAVVRCVEVEPAALGDLTPVGPVLSAARSIELSAEEPHATAGAPVPVVVPSLSKFSVTVECIGPVPGADPAPPKKAVRPSA